MDACREMIGAGDQLVKVQRGAAEAEFIVSSDTRLLDLGDALFSMEEFKLARCGPCQQHASSASWRCGPCQEVGCQQPGLH